MVVVTEDNGVRTIALNRPEVLNAWNNQQYDEVTEALLAAERDDACRVVVMTGTGRAFSAGADLSSSAYADDPPKHGIRGFLRTVVDFPKPFLLGINGLGVGIGATLAGLADVAYMAESARLRCPFTELGLVAEAGSTVMFPALMGRQRAMWFLLSSEWMSATECKQAGLVLDVYPDDGFLAAVQAQAAKLAALPTASIAGIKRLIVDPGREHLKAVIDTENATIRSLQGQPANREAIAAFREKRKPDFSSL
ncbi:MAG: enoyl-CoA hydratase/isomerase family protein [Gammaproteobacteria bacterium]|nr:enoyl-CoA hydratase/isomerase family protein [Gammaproteobacteria bacterium]